MTSESETERYEYTTMALVEEVRDQTVLLQTFNVRFTERADIRRPRICDLTESKVPTSERFPAQWWQERTARPVRITGNWKTGEVTDVLEL
jgi:hypothetical protein